MATGTPVSLAAAFSVIDDSGRLERENGVTPWA